MLPTGTACGSRQAQICDRAAHETYVLEALITIGAVDPSQDRHCGPAPKEYEEASLIREPSQRMRVSSLSSPFASVIFSTAKPRVTLRGDYGLTTLTPNLVYVVYIGINGDPRL